MRTESKFAVYGGNKEGRPKWGLSKVREVENYEKWKQGLVHVKHIQVC